MLIRQILNGTEAGRSRLIEGNLKKVLSYAKDYADRGLPMNDLVQEANMALFLFASEYENGDFDAQMEKKVRAAIEDALQIQNRETKIEEEMAARVNVLKDISASMARELGREATLAELAERMKMSEDEIRDIMKLTMDAMKVSGQAAEMAQKEIDEQE